MEKGDGSIFYIFNADKERGQVLLLAFWDAMGPMRVI
jgi:hypothetical protein